MMNVANILVTMAVLLQALQTLQELPLSLIAESPAHIPNWDLVADIVNGCSRTYRSPKQCKNRFENFIVAREEGRAVYDPSPRKMKKTVKGLYKVSVVQIFMLLQPTEKRADYMQNFDLKM